MSLDIAFTISDAVISGAVSAVAGAVIWSIRTVTKLAKEYFNKSDVRQDKILELVQTMAADMAVGKTLNRMYKAIQKLDSKVFTCDDCGGWDGPADQKPRGVEQCRCSDPTASNTATSGKIQ